jgi:hypothetical protein
MDSDDVVPSETQLLGQMRAKVLVEQEPHEVVGSAFASRSASSSFLRIQSSISSG